MRSWESARALEWVGLGTDCQDHMDPKIIMTEKG